MYPRAVIDVSGLPRTVLDHRSPIWWGNILLLAIETTRFAIMIASYLYFRVVDFQLWPPPPGNSFPPLYNSAPDLLLPTINLLLLLSSIIPMLLTDKACLQRNIRV